jgi:hypothetical protein
MKIVESRPQVDGAVRYLLRDGHGKITVDVKDGEEMTGFTRHGYEGDEDKALKKAFKFLESKSVSMSPAMPALPTSLSAVSYACRDDYIGG